MIYRSPESGSVGGSITDSVSEWLLRLAEKHSDEELSLIKRAYDVAVDAHMGQTRLSGEPYIEHSLAVAEILSALNMDHETIAAAILHDVVEDTDVTLDELSNQFGGGVATLVNGVTKMGLIQTFRHVEGEGKKEHTQAESLRKMLLAMAEDIRVVMIKLADRTHNLRTLSALPEHKQKLIARETLDIYAPLANRLGIWQIKWELEDLSFRYLNPERYKTIANMLAESRVEREGYITSFMTTLNSTLVNAGLTVKISGRPKHIYSIWRKMDLKHIEYNQLYDIRGVRILVDDVKDCYTTLGIVHSMWQYIAGEFDDYIATPKENNYQSIHTAIIGPDGKVIEVQIRTHDMHRHNELGVAAHWRYKEGSKSDAYDNKINWLRGVLEWKEEVLDAGEFVEQFKSELFIDRIYVFTPKGNIVDLAAGATPLDFAYHIHTDVGHRCRGAKVNGKIVPLAYTLQSGEQVEIQTIKSGRPSRDWLNSHLGYLKTSRALSKVRHWFREQNYEHNVDEGRSSFERELKRMGFQNINLEKLSERLHYKNIDDMFAAIANGELKGPRYLGAIQKMIEPAKDVTALQNLPDIKVSRVTEGDSGIRIQGVGNLMTHIANCCKPIKGDPIIGFITRGRGVTIHRDDCSNVEQYQHEQAERLVPVEWGGDEGAEQGLQVDILVLAYDRQGLLRDIVGVLSNENVNMIAVDTLSDEREMSARMRFTLQISNLDRLSRVLAKIEQLQNVTAVQRIMH